MYLRSLIGASQASWELNQEVYWGSRIGNFTHPLTSSTYEMVSRLYMSQTNLYACLIFNPSQASILLHLTFSLEVQQSIWDVRNTSDTVWRASLADFRAFPRTPARRFRNLFICSKRAQNDNILAGIDAPS